MTESAFAPRPWLSLPLAPAAAAFGAVARARGALYDRGLLPIVDVGAPVISVGNITAGGTGKTPIVESVARGLLARGRRPAIVSRGYGGSERGPARAPATAFGGGGVAAERYGDEPACLARALPSVPVCVGRDRVAAARFALAIEDAPGRACDCLIADDGFQHRRLARAFDLAIVDATEPLWHYWPLPYGRAREPIAALGRARAIVLNKVNLVTSGRLAEARALAAAGAPGVRLVECRYAIRHLAGPDGRAEPIEAARGLRAFCASGIGRPEAFRATLRLSGVEIAGSADFPDHARFSQADFARIEAEAARASADAIVVTEKDAVKMSAWTPRLPLRIARLSAEPEEGWDRLHDEMDRLLF